jgi:hypothetical protein
MDDSNIQLHKIINTTQGDGGPIVAFHRSKGSILMIFMGNNLELQVDDVIDYVFVPLSNLFEKKIVLICVCQQNTQNLILRSYLLDADTHISYRLLTQIEIPADLCESGTQTQEIEAENVPLVQPSFQNCILASSESHLALYSPTRHSLYVWNISLNSVIKTSEISTAISYTCKLTHLFQFDVFATVFCLRMTNTHIVLGRLNSIHIYNWKYIQKRREHLLLEGKFSNSKANINEDEVIKKERLGRCIYLPRVTKTKQTVNKVVEDIKKQDTIRQSRVRSPLEIEEKSSIIAQKENEKVVDVKAYTNSKFIVRSNLGNMYALDCVMPFDKDSFVRLGLPAPLFNKVCIKFFITNFI